LLNWAVRYFPILRALRSHAARAGTRPKPGAVFFGIDSCKTPGDGISALEIAKRRLPGMGVVFGQYVGERSIKA
jgi:hypothetical protein